MRKTAPNLLSIYRDFLREPFPAVEDLLQAGIPAYFADPRLPEGYIRANPDGTHTLIRFNGEDWEDVRDLRIAPRD